MRRVLQLLGLVAALCFWPVVGQASEASDDVNQKELTTQDIATAIRAQDIAQIEELYETALTQRTRFDDGAWHLTAFYEAFRRVVNEAADEAEIDEVDSVLTQWQARSPGKAGPYLAHATVALARSARRATDGVISNDVVAETKSYLAAHKDVVSLDPHGFAIEVWLATLENAGIEALEPILRAALRADPDYFVTYLLAAEHVLFRANDRGEAFEAFAKLLRVEAGPELGDGYYARVYLHAMITLYGNDLFKASAIDWDVMKLGIRSLIEKFPSSGLNRNYFALMGCLKNDKDIARPLIDDILDLGREPPSWVWGEYRFFDACRAWATGEQSYTEVMQFASPLVIQGSARLLSSDQSKRFTATYERALRDRVNRELGSLLFAGDFAGLERVAERYRSKDMMTPSGVPMLALLYDGMQMVIKTGRSESDGQLKQRLERYLVDYPNSPTPIILMANFMMREAYAAQKKGGTGKITPQSKAEAIRLSQIAVQFLEQRKEVGRKDFAWYTTTMGLGRILHWAPARTDPLVEEGVKLHPFSREIYFGGIYFHLYTDGYLNGNMEPYVRWVISLAPPEEREALYARLYWVAEQQFLSYNVLRYTAASWPDMKRGFEALIQTNRTGLNESAYAYFSCLAGDIPKLKELLPKLAAYNEDPAWEVWQTPPLLDQCLRMAAPPDSFDTKPESEEGQPGPT